MKMVVKIKTWKDMEKEFGIRGGMFSSRRINTSAPFYMSMEREMPDDRIIEVTEYSGNKYTDDKYYAWFSDLDKDTDTSAPWTISEDMIEEIPGSELKPHWLVIHC